MPGSTDRDRDYWRDVGTLDAYYEANMDLISVRGVQPVQSRVADIDGDRRLPPRSSSMAIRIDWVDSFVSPGVIVFGGGSCARLSPRTYVHSWAHVEDSVVMHGTRIGRHSKVVKAILDKNVVVRKMPKVGIGSRPRHRARLRSPNPVSRSFPKRRSSQVSMTHHLDDQIAHCCLQHGFVDVDSTVLKGHRRAGRGYTGACR